MFTGKRPRRQWNMGNRLFINLLLKFHASYQKYLLTVWLNILWLLLLLNEFLLQLFIHLILSFNESKLENRGLDASRITKSSFSFVFPCIVNSRCHRDVAMVKNFNEKKARKLFFSLFHFNLSPLLNSFVVIFFYPKIISFKNFSSSAWFIVFLINPILLSRKKKKKKNVFVFHPQRDPYSLLVIMQGTF